MAAWLHREGRGVPKDLARAAALLERACRLGDKRSCVEHAWAQAHGEGLPKAEPAARATLEALCSDEVFAACTRLALLHAATPKASELARAKELLARACAGGEAEACRLAQGKK
jgi:TPR repeat protein